MARLVYTTITSLDGYVADADGRFDWCMPDEEVHSFVNELERGVGTHLYGRRLYEVMRFWESFEEEGPEGSAAMREYAEIWRAADKIVYSRTLDEPSTARTRIEWRLDPDVVRRLVDESDRDVGIGGPTLAGPVIRAGIVDEFHSLLAPVVVGGGTRALPDDVRLDLELVSERRFAGGFVHLHHRARR